jgi:hypothetical protein
MIAEEKKIVPVLVTADINTSADLDSIDMSNYHKATFIYIFGVVGGDVTFSFKSGASAGTKTTYVPFNHALGGAAIGTAVAGSTASCDVLGAWGNVPADGATDDVAITCTTKMVVCEINASAMEDGEPWLTGTVAASDGIVHAVAILEPRYTGNRSATALA